MALVFDIETVGESWDDLDEATQGALTRWIKHEAKSDEEYQASLTDVKQGLGFSPLTGSIVAIGVYDTEKGRAQFISLRLAKRLKSLKKRGLNIRR